MTLRRRPLYSACNEDTRSELRALVPSRADTVVCVAAGGGRALSLLGAGAGRFLAVDRRPAQLCALELKAAALDALPYRAFRCFLGVEADPDRLDVYAALRASLSPRARRYWNARPRLVRDGVLYAGRTETWLARFASLLRHAGGFEWPAACFAARDLDEQRAVLARRRAEVARAERGFALFFHPLVAWLATQDPSFLRSSEGNVGRCLYRRFASWGERHLFRESFLLSLIYFGGYDPRGALPIYLTRAGHECARKELARLELVCADLAELPPRLASAGPIKWSISDVGCWMSERRFHALVGRLAGASPPGSRLTWRNLAAHRGLPPGAHLRRLDALSAALDRDDASVFYRFEVAEVVCAAAERPSSAAAFSSSRRPESTSACRASGSGSDLASVS
jgi:S-adenosylmethionine-diacylglycerol 3-amino-3-carboxypropyl transferase